MSDLLLIDDEPSQLMTQVRQAFPAHWKRADSGLALVRPCARFTRRSAWLPHKTSRSLSSGRVAPARNWSSAIHQDSNRPAGRSWP
jgi:hypothetical protein